MTTPIGSSARGVFIRLAVASAWLLAAGTRAGSPPQPLRDADASDAPTAKPPIAVAADGPGAAYRAADPRLDAACRAAHGAAPAPAGGVLAVRTVEDAFVSDAAQLARLRGTFFRPYGRLLNTTGALGSALFVEVPKAGSSTFKKALGMYEWTKSEKKVPERHRAEVLRLAAENRSVPAFAIVREPLARALSAFGEVRTRAGKVCDWLGPRNKWRWAAVCEQPWIDAPNMSLALAGYTDWLTHGGLARAAAARGLLFHWKVALMHAFSQTFFLSLCPWALAAVVRLESLESGVRAFEAQHGQLLRLRKGGSPRPRLQLNSKRRTHNVDHGGVVRTLGQGGRSADRAILRRLEEYYRQDYVCLGYARTA